MKLSTKKIIVFCIKMASISKDGGSFASLTVMPLHGAKKTHPNEFNEFIEWRDKLLISTNNKIEKGDNAWEKLYLAFKTLVKSGHNYLEVESKDLVNDVYNYNNGYDPYNYKKGYDFAFNIKNEIKGNEHPSFIGGYKAGKEIYNFYNK